MEIVARQDATERGLKRYFTGRPCKHGHVCERYTKLTICVECAAANRHAWGEAFPERVRDGVRRWVDSNRGKYRASARRWRMENPEKRKAVNKAYEDRHREQLNAKNRARYQRNLEKQRMRSRVKHATRADQERVFRREWRRANPEKVKAERNRRRAAKLNAGGKFTAEDVSDVLRLQKHRCAYCRTSLQNRAYHVDHIIPLTKGGSNGRENIQITCPRCNLSKGRRDPLDFARSIGKLL